MYNSLGTDTVDSRAQPMLPPNLDLDQTHHERPFFKANRLVSSKFPILYLPPLLSSLPRHITLQPTLHLEKPPLTTETRLREIDPVSISLHKALHKFKPMVSHYATVPYEEAFNWSELNLPIEEEREWYCVVFRSKRKAESDNEVLYVADREAHEEAVGNGGLILYWYGVPDESTGSNLATCIWQSRKHALIANSGPLHIKAMRLAAASYEVYTLERFVLRKEKGQSKLLIYPYTKGEIGW